MVLDVRLKNLNSTKNIMLAIDYEVTRQANLLDQAKEVKQQTRLFDVNSGETRVMREKEDSMIIDIFQTLIYYH